MLYEYKAKLIKVLDGDTIKSTVDLGFNIWISVTIRLIGIDAPETRTKNLEEKANGKLSKEWLINLLKENNNEFRLLSTGVDKYGRCLAEIYVDSLGIKSVQNKMIEEGLASIYNI